MHKPYASYIIGNCTWERVEDGQCVPDCGGGFKEAYYIIKQEAAGGGNDCPDFVKENVTEIIECYGELLKGAAECV